MIPTHITTKPLDVRIKKLVERCVLTRERGFFVIVGHRARDRVANLHYLLSHIRTNRPSGSPSLVPSTGVLWCYDRELGFKSDERARKNELAKQLGSAGAVQDDPFHLFLSITNIRYCYFKDTQRILGNTFLMLIVQDFHSLTPNVLARTFETVCGGGLVILLLPTLTNLKQLYTMTMDVHSRFRREGSDNSGAGGASGEFVGRFNERFLLSLATCRNCLVVNDELTVLPISRSVADEILTLDRAVAVPAVTMGGGGPTSEKDSRLVELKQRCDELGSTGDIVKLCVTYDQANALLAIAEAVKAEKSLQTTVALLAARGRGKSACLGLVVALAVSHGYSNLFVTAPSPENLKTFFQFVLRGLAALGYEDRADFQIVQSSNPRARDCIVRVNIYKAQHRQTVQYILPTDSRLLGQAELLVIDEAAAIPLPIVQELLGPYLIFISSTVNGYEGTGRSLSLKLLERLRKGASSPSSSVAAAVPSGSGGVRIPPKTINSSLGVTRREYRELTLVEPIRYCENDPVEDWMTRLLCLDATSRVPPAQQCAHPDSCDLYYVNRDTLFAFHPETEEFLHNMVSLFVASHYRNTPNDLQMLADAPDHHVFALLGPIEDQATSLPSIYCAAQVAFEGGISRELTQSFLSQGKTGSGDLIPWLVSRFFQEPRFGELSGVRIVRIATHPDVQRMGYGSCVMQLLVQYFSGSIFNLADPVDEEIEDEGEDQQARMAVDGAKKKKVTVPTLEEEIVVPRAKSGLPPLLEALEDRPNETIDYLGVSYGVTLSLHNFWRKFGFRSVYVRLTPNSMTGEHSCIMLRNLCSTPGRIDFVRLFHRDFRRRFAALLSCDFRKFSLPLALSMLDFDESRDVSAARLSVEEFRVFFTPYDLKRLNFFSRNLLDLRVILDLIPSLGRLFFAERLPVRLNLIEGAILVALGFQKKTLRCISDELGLPISQISSIFNAVSKKLVAYLNRVHEDVLVFEEHQRAETEQAADSPKRKRESVEVSEERPTKKLKLAPEVQ